MIFCTTSCNKEFDEPLPDSSGEIDELNSKALKRSKQKLGKAIGSVEIIWKGGEKANEKGSQPEQLLAFFDFNAHEGDEIENSKGDIVFLVTEADYTFHREIKASVIDVHIDSDQNKAWFVAQVVSDSKGCEDDDGGHDTGCSGDDHTDHEGGDSSDDTNQDTGCSHDDVDDSDAAHDGGCSHDDTDDGGCSDDDTDDVDHESGTSGGGDKGNPLSGKNCRVGQMIAVKVHDNGSPGVNGDGITWKWFDSNTTFPTTTNTSDWPHLCKKIIINGNIVVHKQ